MSKSIQQDKQQPSYPQSQPLRETPGSHRVSTSNANASSHTREYTVARGWGYQGNINQSSTTGQQASRSSGPADMSVMMLRWLRESSQEQPYNSISSYIVKVEEPTDATNTVHDYRDPHHGAMNTTNVVDEYPKSRHEDQGQYSSLSAERSGKRSFVRNHNY